jgi:hypothetical protein
MPSGCAARHSRIASVLSTVPVTIILPEDDQALKFLF